MRDEIDARVAVFVSKSLHNVLREGNLHFAMLGNVLLALATFQDNVPDVLRNGSWVHAQRRARMHSDLHGGSWLRTSLEGGFKN